MKKFLYASAYITIAFLFISANALKAQVVLQTWDFESSMGHWVSGPGGASIELSTAMSHSGSQSLKMVQSNTNTEINLQNDVDKAVEGDSIYFWIWMSAADLAGVDGVQIFWQDGSGWNWNSQWINATDITGDAWNQVGITFPAIESPLQRIGLQISGASGTESNTPTLYVDDITVLQPGDPTVVSQWGVIGGRMATDWHFVPGEPGNAGVAGDVAPSGNWTAIRGGFAPITATEEEAVVITGKIEFIGAGPSTWCAIRYGLFDHDSVGTLVYAGTDSAHWTGFEKYARGYMFAPHSGTNDQVGWGSGGNGTQGVTRDGNWISSNAPNLSLGVNNQKPPRAEATAGIYDFAMSVQPLSDGTKELRFYMIKEHAANEQTTYWYGGTVIDTTYIGSTFNGVCFGLNGGNGAETGNLRGMNLIDVHVNNGAPIEIENPPFNPFYVADWGVLGGRMATDWNFVPGELDGNAGVAGDVAPSGNWTAIRGGFNDEITATLEKAIVVTGKMEFIGAGPSTWCAIRYGLFEHDSVGTLENAGTDSAHWTGYEKYARGYMFAPHSGTNDQVGWGSGGNGTQGVTRDGNWISSNAPNLSLGVNNQKPPRAEATAGIYDFAISVQPLSDGTKELRFYMIKEHAANEQTTYWYAGTVIDTTYIGSTFTGVCFGLNGGNGAETGNLRGLNLTDVYVNLGDPIAIPDPPFNPFYVKDWGVLGGRMATDWHFVPGELDGNAGVAGDVAPSGNWTAIRGGFDDEITATQEKAIIITGKMEFVGAGPSTWCAIRYGLFEHDSVGTLENAGTDSAHWTGYEKYARGYMFAPHSGTNDQVGWGTGGNGTQGVVRDGNWISSNAPNLSLGVNNQKPPRAEATAGIYDFAISVQPLSDGTKELRFYMIKEHEANEQTTYWYAGTVIDTTYIGSTFTGVCFGLNGGNGAETGNLRGLNLTDVYVNLGDPIAIPDPPFNPFYVKDWGVLGGRMATDWHFVPGELDGNAGVAGDVAPSGNWSAIRGGFDDEITATQEKAIIITGKMEFVGAGPSTWCAIRYGLFEHDSVGTLENAGTDSAHWTGYEKYARGYMFAPHSGTNDQVGWGTGGNGTQGVTRDGNWISSNAPNLSLGVNNQRPPRAEATAGIYDFAMSVQPLSDGTKELRFYMIKEHEANEQTTYWYGGTVIDTTYIGSTFTGVCFGLNGGNGAETGNLRGLNLTDVYVNLGDPIIIPTPPFTSFYIATNNWGFIGDPANRIGGWQLTPGELNGNVSISGENPIITDQWSAIRGGFDESIALADLPPDTSLVISGTMQFVGGGFEGWSGLRLGVFYSDSAGVVDSTEEYGQMWTGSEGYHSGYLFIPESGTNTLPTWNSTSGTVGSVINGTWLSTNTTGNYVLSANLQLPEGAVAGEGTYDFKFSFTPNEDGSTAIGYSITKNDQTYAFEGSFVDDNDPIATQKFNAVALAVNSTNTSTTGLNLTDVNVGLGSQIIISVDDPGNGGLLPIQYGLSQNYPNPFNPTTTIEFALPQAGNVSLVVYDALGRVVKELASGDFSAGYHKVNFNATSLASGVYFYRITAGDFVSVKKLMLLK